MKTLQRFLEFDWTNSILPFGVLVVTLVVGFIARRFLFRALRQWAAATQTHADDLVIHAFNGPFMIWVVMLGLFLATQSSELPENIALKINKTLLILWISSLTLVASRLAGNLIKYYGRGRRGTLPVTSLTQNLAHIAIFTLGILLLLNQLGLKITPILTALGVGGLAVALALHDTLSNLFAGFYVSLAGHIRPGDYIKLDSGEEGYVADITWRSTTVKTAAENLVIVPNAKLAQAIVTNYHLPQKPMIARMTIGVSYDCEPDDIERLLIEEAEQVATSRPDLITSQKPVVRFLPGFGDSSIDFTLYFQVPDFEQQFPAQHELRKRIFRRFREAGIEIPFPIRTVYLRQNSSQEASRGEKALH